MGLEVAHLLAVDLRRADAQPQPGRPGVGTRLQQRQQLEHLARVTVRLRVRLRVRARARVRARVRVRVWVWVRVRV